MTVEALVIGVFGAIGITILGILSGSVKEWKNSVERNTIQVGLLNQKLEYFVDEIETIRSDVDQLKMWRAKTDPEWK